jgi:hypothetical protein
MKKPVKISRDESHLAVKIRMLRVDDAGDSTNLADATAFVWEANGTWFLVSNLHNFTGWNYAERKSLSDTGASPSHLEVFLGAYHERLSDNKFLFGKKGYTVSLTVDDKPKWLVHPVLGTKVDVGILEICDVPNAVEYEKIGISRFATIPANRHDWVNYEAAAGDDAFVLGYPYGMECQGLPIWKRASIATEPDMDLDGLPKLLLDTATRKGMSGSPVIGVRRGVVHPSGEMGDDSVFGESMNFLGVYSGRIGEDPLGVQLGVVWKASVIEEIIEGGRKGEWPWIEESSDEA